MTFAMRPVYLLVRMKNLHQSDGLHFINDFLKNHTFIHLQFHLRSYEKEHITRDADDP